MLRKHDLVERLGTSLNSYDSPTERLQSFVNYLADNYYFLLAVYTGHAGMSHPAVANRLK